MEVVLVALQLLKELFGALKALIEMLLSLREKEPHSARRARPKHLKKKSGRRR